MNVERYGRRWLCLIGMLVALALVAAACGDDDDEATGQTATPQAGEQPAAPSGEGFGDTIKVGTICATSGPTSTTLKQACQLQEAMFEYFNDEGGVHGRMFETVVGDDGFTDAAKGTALVRKFVESDDVELLFGIVAPYTCAAVADYVDQQEIPMFCPGSNDEEFGHPYLYLAAPSQKTFASRAAARYAVEDLGHKRIALIHQSVPAYVAGADEFQATVEELGGEIVTRQAVAPDEEDYTGAVVNIRDADPDAVYILLLPPGVFKYYLAAQRLGYQVERLHGPTGSGPAVPREFGDFADPYDSVVTYSPPPDDHLMYEIYDKYIGEGNYDPALSLTERVLFTQAMILREALEKAGPDAGIEEIKEVLDSESFDFGLTAEPIEFGSEHSIDSPPFTTFSIERFDFETERLVETATVDAEG